MDYAIWLFEYNKKPRQTFAVCQIIENTKEGKEREKCSAWQL